MGANIITGYTGTRHITPAMDAAVYRSTFGADSYILSDGNQLSASMPDINSFTILDGLVSMQGHQVQITQETLSVDTCANGYSRIDLVCLRFEHDNGSSVDSTSLVVIKGTEVQDPNTPSVPTHNTGDIDSGATIVDFPLYQLNLSGSTITITQLAEVVEGTIRNLPRIVEQGMSGLWNYRKWSDGTAECWGIFSEKTISITTVYGNAFYGALQTVAFPNDLFVSRPTPSLSLRNSNGVWTGINGLSATYVSYYPFCSKSGNQTIEESVYAIGRWE